MSTAVILSLQDSHAALREFDNTGFLTLQHWDPSAWLFRLYNLTLAFDLFLFGFFFFFFNEFANIEISVIFHFNQQNFFDTVFVWPGSAKQISNGGVQFVVSLADYQGLNNSIPILRAVGWSVVGTLYTVPRGIQMLCGRHCMCTTPNIYFVRWVFQHL